MSDGYEMREVTCKDGTVRRMPVRVKQDTPAEPAGDDSNTNDDTTTGGGGSSGLWLGIAIGGAGALALIIAARSA